jgi:hypothetical protein
MRHVGNTYILTTTPVAKQHITGIGTNNKEEKAGWWPPPV